MRAATVLLSLAALYGLLYEVSWKIYPEQPMLGAVLIVVIFLAIVADMHIGLWLTRRFFERKGWPPLF